MTDSLSDENVIQLLERYDKGNLSPEEEALFFQWYRKAGWEEFSRLWAQCKTFPTGGITHSPEIPLVFKEQLEEAIDNFENSDDGSVYLIRKPWVRNFAVAVSAIVVVCVGIVWWFKPASKRGSIVTQSNNLQDVRPGGNKAVLTLANGTRIILDSAEDGKLAQQGTTGVIKVSARIIYEAGKGGEVLYNTITTPRGGQYQVQLPDGSMVWLNSASTLKFPTSFSGDSREVELTGEGYFEIEKNPSMPFMITVPSSQVEEGMKVQVLGTHFDIMAYPEEKMLATTLIQGAVKVFQGNREASLVPGQQATITPSASAFRVGHANIQKVLAWKDGLFEFDDTGLSTIMRQLARWYDIEVVYSATIKNENDLGGSIKKNMNLSAVLKLMESNGINHFRIEGKKVIVLP